MADPLVLLPGLMSDARVFWPQIAELSAKTAVTVAPITQGERIEEIASGLLDQLPKRFALAGLGLGGAVALEILRRAPDRLTRLALIDASPLAETPQSAAAREMLIVKVKSGRLADAMREELNPVWLAPGPDRAAILEIALDMADTLLRKCKVPTLVMCGEVGRLNPVKRHSFMAELLPYAILRVIEGAGHLPTLEQPEATTAAIKEWLKMPLTPA
jgi:pimeloyl-ACP methyl ester carboxylesterase